LGILTFYKDYQELRKYIWAGWFDEAAAVFLNLGDYRDAPYMILGADYRHAKIMFQNNEHIWPKRY
jgi:hypothetical protein